MPVRICLALLLLLTLSLSTSCDNPVGGSGVIETEERALPAVRRIKVCCDIQTVVQIGDENKIELTGDDNILPVVVTRFDSDQLILEFSNVGRDLELSQPLQAVITLEKVTSLQASDGASIEASGIDITERLLIDVVGGSSANVTSVNASSVAVNATGDSQISVAGTTTTITGQVRDNSTLNASSLIAEQITLALEGNSTADVHATGTLSVTASGASKMTLSGGADVIKEDLSGDSTLEMR